MRGPRVEFRASSTHKHFEDAMGDLHAIRVRGRIDGPRFMPVDLAVDP